MATTSTADPLNQSDHDAVEPSVRATLGETVAAS
jgi:hypothetical protein